MKLCIFTEDNTYYTNNGFYSNNPLSYMYTHLRNYFDEIIVSSPSIRVDTIGESQLIKDIKLAPRPYYGGSVSSFFKSIHKIAIPTIRNIYTCINSADLIMIRIPSPIAIISWIFSRIQNKPYFVYIAGDVVKAASHGDKYNKITERVIAKAASKYFRVLEKIVCYNTLSFAVGSDLYKEFNKVSKKCVMIIPSTITTEIITRKRLDATKKEWSVLYVGRLVPVKGIMYLLQAISILERRNKKNKITLHLAGDGYARSKLEKMADTLKISHMVKFHGRIPFGENMWNMYKRADLFVLPSLSEGIPKVILEAMAFGLPVIATNVGGIPDVVKHKKTGLLVEPRSPEQLAQAIEEIIENKELRENIIYNSHQFIKEHTVERFAESMWKEIASYWGLDEK